MKWEEYGTTLNLQDTSMITHGVHYIKAISGEKKAASRTESKMPKDVTTEFDQLLKQANIKLNIQEIKSVKQKGISGMRDILKAHSNDLASSKDLLASFDTFLTTTKKYDANTLQHRKANEVILHASNSTSM